MSRFAVVARFPAGSRERVRELLAGGPPFELAETGLDRHAVYLSSNEAVFVFEGAEALWEVDELADDFFHPELAAALDEWRTVIEEQPHVATPVFEWSRGEEAHVTEAPEELRLVDVMDRDFVTAAPEDTVGETVEKLAEHGPGPALVLDYGRFAGVLTPHDVMRAVAGRTHPSEARVRDWMSAAPAALAADASPESAVQAMIEQGLHELPVVEEDRVVGVVTLRSAVRRSLAGAG
jgi:CBS domain-containing protein